MYTDDWVKIALTSSRSSSENLAMVREWCNDERKYVMVPKFLLKMLARCLHVKHKSVEAKQCKWWG